jgi:hypothetical protein
MDVTFGALDAFAFVVMAVIAMVAVVIVVSLGKLPGQLARQWGHPQAPAVNVAGWLGIATGGLLWPFALIWAFMAPAKPLLGEIREAPPSQALAREPPTLLVSAQKDDQP